eukprot:GFUD01045739.1.p1 GENE.GFUD01045739.1~~GFUD01045739.1.p1  ORF type:complete len:313 (+),score=49.48 GFUD01045739.1:62-1000(+)
MILNQTIGTSVISCLQYGIRGPSCQQVCLVTEPSGQKIFTGIPFISLFSKYLATILKDSQFHAEVPTIIVPVRCHILQKLFEFLSKGTVVCGDIEDAFAVGKAAEILGITPEDWKIETSSLKLEVSEESYVSHEVHSTDTKNKWKDIDVNLMHFKGRRKFPCGIHNCKSSFQKMADLNRHMKTHDALDPGYQNSGDEIGRKCDVKNIINRSSCDVCGKSYRSKGNLIAHKIAKHSSTFSPQQLTSNQCPICKKTLNKQYLVHHINRHFPEEVMMKKRSNACPKCKSTFYRRTHLNRHMKSKHGTDDTQLNFK